MSEEFRGLRRLEVSGGPAYTDLVPALATEWRAGEVAEPRLQVQAPRLQQRRQLLRKDTSQVERVREVVRFPGRGEVPRRAIDLRERVVVARRLLTEPEAYRVPGPPRVRPLSGTLP
jgi:hypothetical protein